MKTDKEKLAQAETLLKTILDYFLRVEHNELLELEIENYFKKEESFEPTIAFTYAEIFSRADNSNLNKLGINPWYINEGGDAKDVIMLNATRAKLIGVGWFEFAARLD